MVPRVLTAGIMKMMVRMDKIMKLDESNIRFQMMKKCGFGGDPRVLTAWMMKMMPRDVKKSQLRKTVKGGSKQNGVNIIQDQPIRKDSGLF